MLTTQNTYEESQLQLFGRDLADLYAPIYNVSVVNHLDDRYSIVTKGVVSNDAYPKLPVLKVSANDYIERLANISISVET